MQERGTLLAGYRFFSVELEQPIDHAAPAGPTFRQFASLLWKGPGRPVVLATSGYDAPRLPSLSEVTALLDANQLMVEHRFFGTSAPSPADWSKLDMAQAAADHHRVVESLRPVLGGKWISAGASKGGMTAVYHRRFYPADVDGTVAYVAPNSYSTSDPVYVDFLEAAVGTAECRQALKDFQHALLARRAEVQPLFEASASPGDGFTTFGPDKAFEYAVVELSFVFWQYGTMADCAGIPVPEADATALFAFMNGTLGNASDWIGDQALTFYAPYFYQAATQLGGPAYPQDHLLDVLPGNVPADDVPKVYPPLGVEKIWDPVPVPDVASWVSSSGQRLLFVYGQNDPWSSRPFAPSAGNDSWSYTVPAGNHLSRIALLPDDQRASATAAVRRWAGVGVAGAISAAEVPDHDPWALLHGERGLSSLRRDEPAAPAGIPRLQTELPGAGP